MVMSDDHYDEISAANRHLIFIREKKRNLHCVQNDLTNQINHCPDSHFVVWDKLGVDGGRKCQECCHGKVV